MTKRSIVHLTSGRLGSVLVAVVIAWGAIYLFVQLTKEWQIALGAVGAIAAYLLFNGYRDHRIADAADASLD